MAIKGSEMKNYQETINKIAQAKEKGGANNTYIHSESINILAFIYSTERDTILNDIENIQLKLKLIGSARSGEFFENCVKAKDWKSLGNWFFRGFVEFDLDSMERKELNRLYKSLTKKQRKMLEE